MSEEFEEENASKDEGQSEEQTAAEVVHEEKPDYKDLYLRLLADMENAKKRMQKERVETIQYASERVIADFLPALDNLENALRFADQASVEVKNWAMGFQMILGQFKEVLVAQGVTQIPSLGAAFDPHSHEAVETVETNEHPDGTILEEFTKGYRMGTRIIRPARVKVAKKIEG